MPQKHVFVKNKHLVGFLRVISREKFPLKLEVLVISVIRDNKLVEPWGVDRGGQGLNGLNMRVNANSEGF